MDEHPKGVFSSHDAKLNISADADRHWHGYGPTWVELNLGMEIDAWQTNYEGELPWPTSAHELLLKDLDKTCQYIRRQAVGEQVGQFN